jgi:hypothetical protein
MPPLLVDPEVTRRKFERELSAFKSDLNFQRRGWLLLSEDHGTPAVDIAFFARVSSTVGEVPVAVCAVRLKFDNYDLWPPSLTFIDPFTRETARPLVRAFASTPDGLRDLLIEGHPSNKQPFLCMAGIREYHWHPQHTGDSWLLHRSAKEGTLATVCERIWRLMVRNVIGLRVTVQGFPGMPLRAQVDVQVAQGDVDRLMFAPAPAQAQPQSEPQPQAQP